MYIYIKKKFHRTLYIFCIYISIYIYIFKIKVYNNEITDDATYELLYDTTNTVPGGAIYHDGGFLSC